MPVDIFPSLNLPVIYVASRTAAWTPRRWKAIWPTTTSITSSTSPASTTSNRRTSRALSLMKLYFHPGTNMPQAMAETVNYVNRARAFMPPGTVSPFVIRFDTGSVPVGYLVLSSETHSIGEIQDLRHFRVRPMFASLPGVSAPPPFGGNQPHRRGHGRSATSAGLRPDARRRGDRLGPGQRDQPVGQFAAGGKYPFVPVNSVVRDVHDLENIPLRAARNRRSISRTSDTCRTAPIFPPATRWSTAAAACTSWSPSGPTPRR